MEDISKQKLETETQEEEFANWQKSQSSEYWQKQMSHAPTLAYYTKLLEIVKELKPEKVLEIGTGWGISGSAFLESGFVKEFTTIDPNINVEYGKKSRKELESKEKDCKVKFVEGRAETSLPKMAEAGRKFNLVYIDGDHSYKAVKRDLENAERVLEDKGVIVLDDYLHPKNKSTDPEQAYGVKKAVTEYCEARRKRVEVYSEANGFAVIF